MFLGFGFLLTKSPSTKRQRPFLSGPLLSREILRLYHVFLLEENMRIVTSSVIPLQKSSALSFPFSISFSLHSQSAVVLGVFSFSPTMEIRNFPLAVG